MSSWGGVTEDLLGKEKLDSRTRLLFLSSVCRAIVGAFNVGVESLS